MTDFVLVHGTWGAAAGNGARSPGGCAGGGHRVSTPTLTGLGEHAGPPAPG
jgi:hypothetical protein